MAKINKPEVKNVATSVKATTASVGTTAKPSLGSSVASKNTVPSIFMFDKINYIIMAVGLVVLALGFFLMSGGATTDPNVFPKEEIYSARRITLAPMVILLGFGIELIAIFYKTASIIASDKEFN